jgi:putative tryptophan/tyrosine transport system substrate-binding protein
MRRREFIGGLGSAAAWPFTARAQQGGPTRRLGNLWARDENDALQQTLKAAFYQRLAELGWVEGRNLKIDDRWNPRTPDETRTFAKELVDLHPDVLTTGTSRLTRALQQQTKTIPIVMLGAGDPLALGLVASIARPEGNTTGVTDIFPSIAGKWLELLKKCVPSLSRVALILNPDRLSNNGDSFAIPAAQAGSQYAVKTVNTSVRSVDEIERAISAFASEPGGGLIILPPPFLAPERQMINRLAVRYRLPVIYQDRSFAIDGGLLSYGADFLEMFRQGAPYVDRILRGAKPGDLPVQFPTKFILTVNLKTAKEMGLPISEAFLLRADEVIE